MPKESPIISPAVIQHCVRFLELHEERVPHMYLDTEGVVTYGVGKALFSCADALKVPFVDLAGNPASAMDISEDYAAVHKVRGNYKAPFFKALTKTRVTDVYMDRQLELDIAHYFHICCHEVDGFSLLPESAQVAGVDIAFNCGSLIDWPKFKAALLAHDWPAAKQQCRRKPEERYERRNADIVALLAQAAAQEATAKYKSL